MTKKLPSIFLLIFIINFESQGQCTVINNNACVSNAPTIIGNTINCTPISAQGGRRNFRVNNMIAGATYSVSNCGSGIDTQMTIRNLGGTEMDYNDDDGPDCSGTAASIHFVPPVNGSYRIQMNRYDCATTNALVGNIVVTLLSNPPPPSANDEPCTATPIPLSTATTCTPTVGDNTGATDSANPNIDIPSDCEPISDNYSGADVWFSTIVGSTGAVQVDLTHINSSNFNDGVIALYTGSCGGALSIVECDDDSGLGSLEPKLTAYNLTPGETIYIRVWAWGANAEGTFNICASEPPPTCGSTIYDSGGPSSNYSNDESTTTTFYPDNAGEFVEVTFTAFNTEEDYDELTIYDGPNDTFPSLGTFSGDIRPGPFTSTDPSGALTFIFTSDFSEVRAGWAVDITCVTPCDDNITATTNGANCGEGTVDLSATATAGATAFYWYTADSGGTPIATTSTGDWTTPIITSTTTYYVSIYNGSCESERIQVIANILPEPSDVTISTTTTPIGATDCNLQFAELAASGGEFSSTLTQTVLDLDFETGLTDGISGTWSTVNNSTGGTPANAAWTIRPDSYYTFIYTFNSNDNSNFILSDSDDQGTGNTNTELISPVYSLEFFTSASLSYYHYYNDWSGTDTARVEISTDEGTTWETTTPLKQYTADQGVSTSFTQDTIDLSAYLGQTTLQIRFKYTGAYDLFWAIDNITLEGDMVIPSSDITWTPTNGLFTDASLTTPYNGDPAATVYAAPNGTQIYTATAEGYNGCIKTNTVSITRNGKTWNGSQSTDWYDDDNWTPNGKPTIENCVTIPDVVMSNNNSPIVLGTPPAPPAPALLRALNVKDDAYLELQQYANLIVTDAIVVETDGKVILRNGSNLIQITNTGITNSGNIQMQRTVSSLNPQDYVYWSSPVANFNVSDVSPGSNSRYNWIPTVSGNGIGNYGDWQATTEVMKPGKGYIIRGVTGTNPETTIATNTVEFKGVPRNGAYQVPIAHGGYNGVDYNGAGNTMATALDDNWNLIGNPYPSAISADAFIIQNASILDATGDINTPTIFGTVYLWRHQSAPSSATDPFYGDYAYNYNANDYIGYNSTGSNPSGFNGNIGAGQAFFVLMDHNAPTPSNVSFNNAMRLNSGIVPIDNNEFYRSTENTNQNTIEKHRIWLDLIAPNNMANSILVGYIENATNNVDRIFDGYELSETSNRFYSLVNTEEMTIQGRSLPFVDSDLVPLGVEIASTGNYTIGINTLDGLFNNTNQSIFIEDTYANIMHNLKVSPYSFNSDVGTFNDRFILRYTVDVLSMTDFELSSLNILSPNHSYIKVISEQSPIESVIIYDLLGRVLCNKNAINETEFILKDHDLSDGTYIVKATLTHGRSKSQKIILKH